MAHALFFHILLASTSLTAAAQSRQCTDSICSRSHKRADVGFYGLDGLEEPTLIDGTASFHGTGQSTRSSSFGRTWRQGRQLQSAWNVSTETNAVSAIDGSATYEYNRLVTPTASIQGSLATTKAQRDTTLLRNVTEEAYSCQSHWVSYSDVFFATTGYASTWSTSTWTVSVGTGDIYTTSQGIPVAHGTFTPTGVTTMTSSKLMPDTRTWDHGPLTQPSCVIDRGLCTEMFSSFMDSRNLTLFKDPIPSKSKPADYPRCGEPLVQLDAKGDGTATIGEPCSVWGGTVDLYYWPAQTSTGSAQLVTSGDTSSKVVQTIGNITMTSPYVYLSLNKITAWTEAVEWVFKDTSTITQNAIEHQIGKTYHNILISLHSTDVSTLRYAVPDYSDYMYSLTALGLDIWTYSTHSNGAFSPTPWPIDYDHLTAPPPTEYFMNPNHDCRTDGDLQCGTLWNGDYKPQLALPSQLVNLDPHWSSCQPYIGGVYDPPIALKPAATVAAPVYPTSASPTATTPAEAASTLASPTPFATSTPDQPTASLFAFGVEAHQRSSSPATGTASTAVELSKGYDHPVDPILNTFAPASLDPSSSDSTAASLTNSAVDPEPDASSTSAAPMTAVEAVSKAESLNSRARTSSGLLNAFSILSAAQSDYEGSVGPHTHHRSQTEMLSEPVRTQSLQSVSLPSVLILEPGPQGQTTDGTIVSIDAFTISVRSSAGEVRVGTEELKSGSAVAPDSQTVSYGSSGVLVAVPAGTTTQELPLTDTTHEWSKITFTAGGEIITASVQQSGVAVLGEGTTLGVGGPAVPVGKGETLSIGEDGLLVASQGQTSTFTQAHHTVDPGQATAFVAGSETVTASLQGWSAAILGQSTSLQVGGPAIEIGGKTVSLAPAGLLVEDSGQASSGFLATETTTEAQMATLELGSKTITASLDGPTNLVLDEGSTLTSGGSATIIDSETVSFGSAGLEVASGGHTSIVPLAYSGGEGTSDQAGAEVIVIAGDRTLTAMRRPDHTDEIAVGGTTLSPEGPALTMSGDVWSVTSGGRLVGMNGDMTTTVKLPAITTLEGPDVRTTSATDERSGSRTSAPPDPASDGAASPSSTHSEGHHSSVDVHFTLLRLAVSASVAILIGI